MIRLTTYDLSHFETKGILLQFIKDEEFCELDE